MSGPKRVSVGNAAAEGGGAAAGQSTPVPRNREDVASVARAQDAKSLTGERVGQDIQDVRLVFHNENLVFRHDAGTGEDFGSSSIRILPDHGKRTMKTV